MKVDFTLPDRPIVLTAINVVRKRLNAAATAARAVGHPDTPYAKDLGHLEIFEKAFKGKFTEGKTDKDTAVRLEVSEPECIVMRQGVILLLERHQGTEATLQEELALTDNALMDRLGEVRGLGMRFGGQASLFDPKTAEEKASMAAEMGMPAAAVGAAPSTRKRIVHTKAKDDGRGKSAKPKPRK